VNGTVLWSLGLRVEKRTNRDDMQNCLVWSHPSWFLFSWDSFASHNRKKRTFLLLGDAIRDIMSVNTLAPVCKESICQWFEPSTRSAESLRTPLFHHAFDSIAWFSIECYYLAFAVHSKQSVRDHTNNIDFFWNTELSAAPTVWCQARLRTVWLRCRWLSCGAIGVLWASLQCCIFSKSWTQTWVHVRRCSGIAECTVPSFTREDRWISMINYFHV
jgi:hypothetical protein